MQLVIDSDHTPETYSAGGEHARVRPPDACPACGHGGRLLAHGYYDRYTTGGHGRPIRIRIRRFRCAACSGTVSCLPHFALPYRLVCSATVERGLSAGTSDDRAVNRHAALLKQYWRRFLDWAARAHRLARFSVEMWAQKAPAAVWQALVSEHNGVGPCTAWLVRTHQTTMFGDYECHKRPVTG